jgi:hypothetical protein
MDKTEALTLIITTSIPAICTLAGVIISNHSSNKKIVEEVKSLKEEVNKQEEHTKKNYLGILRLTIMSEEMPVSERIIAGKEYIDNGGNGDVKKFYQRFLKEHTK